jgi:hypothetical protein
MAAALFPVIFSHSGAVFDATAQPLLERAVGGFGSPVRDTALAGWYNRN